MENTLSNKYYLEAYEAYPYDLSDTLESLNYALSYDAEHAAAHCLMGRLYMEHMFRYDKAEQHFEKALMSDLTYVASYYYYAQLLINTGAYGKAKKLIGYAYGIKGIDKSKMLHLEGLIFEKQQAYKAAIKKMKKAYDQSCDDEDRTYLKKQLSRLKNKLKKSKK